MKTEDKIIKLLKEKMFISSTEIAKILGISRQAVNKHMKKLIEQGVVERYGHTRGALYSFVGMGNAKKKRKKIVRKLKKEFETDEIEEDIVFLQFDKNLGLRKYIRPNIYEIFSYAFTEMLNNIIDHSKSPVCRVEVCFSHNDISFKMRDFGIGIFNNIKKIFKLSDEYESVIEITKGKRTTMPESHSGEGIFFTSKLGELMTIRSHNYEIVFDNKLKEIFTERKKYIIGTAFYFKINLYSNKKLIEIFNNFAPEEFNYQFQKTSVSINLLRKEHITRAEAKRLLVGLEKFKEIILDFQNTKIIGQGFADEIFRVFHDRYPKIKLKLKNANKEIVRLVNHIVGENYNNIDL